jgi:20S proteasome subunit beta 2
MVHCRYQGHVGAALVLGGVDPTGPHLFTIAPHGSTDKLPYVTMGSGSLAAMAVFESSWKPNLSVRCFFFSFIIIFIVIIIIIESHFISFTLHISTQRQEALDLVTAAISAGIFNDLGSGSNVDACVITAEKTEMLRNYVKPNERVQKERAYTFRRGTTAWKKENVRDLIWTEEVTPVAGAEGAMDTS